MNETELKQRIAELEHLLELCAELKIVIAEIKKRIEQDKNLTRSI